MWVTYLPPRKDGVHRGKSDEGSHVDPDEDSLLPTKFYTMKRCSETDWVCRSIQGTLLKCTSLSDDTGTGVVTRT